MWVLLEVSGCLAVVLAALFWASIISWRLKWAALVPDEELPLILRGRHNDWWTLLAWIPRKANALVGGRGDPVQLLGSNPTDHHQDVPALGTWCLSWPLHFAASFWGRCIGFGIRRDYIDDYWVLRISLHK